MALSRFVLLLALSLLLGASAVLGYYVPGTYPQEFEVDSKLQAQVNALSSFDTEMPFEYYTLPFCRPPEGIKRIANSANLGTILLGLRIENSPYNFTMKRDETGKLACANGYYGPLTGKEVKDLKHKISNNYRVNMLLDNLPVTDLLDKDQEFVRPGFELGYKKNGKYYLNNHLVFNILVYQTHGEYTLARKQYTDALVLESIEARRMLHESHKRFIGFGGSPEAAVASTSRKLHANAAPAGTKAEDNKPLPQQEEEEEEATPYYMVVGFEVSPCSIKREAGKEIQHIMCGVDDNKDVTPQEIVEGAKIVYTYDVYWQDSTIKWASRWDSYLRMPGGKVHWFSILNSVLVVLVMATIVAAILIRTVRRDLAKYEQLVVDGNSLDMKDEAGWKLLTGDAFRSPHNAGTLAMQVGSGMQIICTYVVTLTLATLGFLSPASRGALLTTTIVLFVLLAGVAGFSAVYAWGLMERSYNNWPRVCFWVAIYFPGIVLSMLTVLNLFISRTGTSGAIPVGMYFGIVAVWFLISIPLCFGGGYLALRAPIATMPTKTNQIPRHIPPPALAANPVLLFLAAGILPFGTIFIELYFAMTSLWLGYFYYLFGFVFIIGLLTVVINAEIAVLCTYVQLCAEDYLWWWGAFHRGGSVAFYLTLYALGFLASSMTTLAGFTPILIYVSYMAIFIIGFYLAMGTVGFLASFYFVYKIFGAVKND